VERFADFMVKDAKTGECFRADHLIEGRSFFMLAGFYCCSGPFAINCSFLSTEWTLQVVKFN